MTKPLSATSQRTVGFKYHYLNVWAFNLLYTLAFLKYKFWVYLLWYNVTIAYMLKKKIIVLLQVKLFILDICFVKVDLNFTWKVAKRLY